MAKLASLAVQSAYLDLMERHRSRRIAALPGTPVKIDQDGRSYWYMQQKLRGRISRTYVGPDNTEIRKLIDTAKNATLTDKEFRTSASALVRQLRAAGLPTLDRTTGSVLNALSRLGAFRLGATLVGTHAYRLYSAELGSSLTQAAEPTEDIDIAQFGKLSIAVDDQVKPELWKEFGKLGLEPTPSLHPGKAWRWQSPDRTTTVEFLAPSFGADEALIELPALGVHAMGLRFLNFLLKDPIQAVGLYREGVLVQIPDPARYAIHKLIVATRRKTPALIKVRKDLAQAAELLETLLEDRPYEIEALWDEACNRGPGWREALNKGAKRLPRTLRARLAELEIG